MCIPRRRPRGTALVIEDTLRQHGAGLTEPEVQSSEGYRDTHRLKKKKVKKNEADTEDWGLPLGWEGVEVVE